MIPRAVAGSAHRERVLPARHVRVELSDGVGQLAPQLVLLIVRFLHRDTIVAGPERSVRYSGWLRTLSGTSL